MLRFHKFADSLKSFTWHSKFDPEIMLETKLQAQGSLNSSKCHFQCGRYYRRLPYVRAPGRIAGERHGVTVVRRHDEQRLVELVGHHIHCCLDKPGLPNLSDCA